MTVFTAFATYHQCPACGAGFATTHYPDHGDRRCPYDGVAPQDIPAPVEIEAAVEPTKEYPHRLTGKTSRTYLNIEAFEGDQLSPIYSYSRGMNVGVGGRWSRYATGEPVRRATLNELRRMDRDTIVKLRAQYPDARIVVQRVRL